MKYSLIILLTLTLFQCRAQAPDWAWTQTITGNYLDMESENHPIINGMITDNSGNIYITGSFYDTLKIGNTLLVSNRSTGMFLAKYSADGILQWSTQSNGNSFHSDAVGSGMCFDNKGNLFICGSFTDTVQFDNFYLNSKGENMFVAAYNPETGICESVRRIGHLETTDPVIDTANSGILSKIFIDTVGNIFLSGITVAPMPSVVDFGGQGVTGIFVVKYDQYYNLIWVNSLNDNNSLESNPIIVDSVGDVFNAGSFIDSVSCEYDELKSVDISTYNSYLVNYNATDGNLNWLTSIGGNEVYTYSATCNNGSYIYLNGDFNGSCRFDSSIALNISNNEYCFLAKYNWAGSPLWAKMFSCEYCTSVDDNIGNTITCGAFNNTMQIGSNTISSAPGNNLFVVKLDGNGNVLWFQHDSISKSTLLDFSLTPYSSTIDKAGNVIVAMSYPLLLYNEKDSINFVLGKDTLKAKATYGTIFLAKLGDAPTGISLPTLPGTGVKLFPNPGDGQFTVDVTQPNYLTNVQVYNIVGQQCKVIVNYSADKLQANVTMNNAAPGVYTVILSSGNSKVAKLFIKQ